MFSWKPIYEEIAKKLLAYRDRQDELISWLHEMKKQGIPVIKLDDENPKGTSVPLTEIDPFTFFATFNRGIKSDHRVRCIEILKDKLDLSAPAPTDFDALPVVNQLNAIFFPFEYDREPHMVASLWDLAAEVVLKEPDEISSELFARCLAIPQVGLAKLTIGMFWIRPDRYLALDSLMASYASDSGAKVGKLGKIKSYQEYRATVANIEATLGKDYPKISRDAFLFANKVPLSVKDLDSGLKTLLATQAEKNGLTVAQFAKHLSVSPDVGEKENEISNRLRTMPMFAAAFKTKPLNIDKLKSACKEAWVLTNGTDSMRRNSFFASDIAVQSILDLLDDNSGVDVQSRIDTFVALAQENGYSSPDGKDGSGAAQFASVLLSAVYPDSFVDYRDNRWNKIFQLVTQSNKRLCTGSSYGWKLVRAGQFAALLASTDTFKQYFGDINATWTVAGLVWWFKDIPLGPPSSKRYWAGGFLWGGQSKKGESHLEEFVEGNYWKTGYSRTGTAKKHIDHWALFDQIKVGDEFAIKGYGGTNDLKIYYVGSVKEIKPDEGIIYLAQLERKLFHGKAPSAGTGGNWFGTLVPVTNLDAIQQVFNGEKIMQSPIIPDFDKNTVLYGPPGTGKTYRSTHMAVQIVDDNAGTLTPELLQERFDALLDEGRVAFITFHQSFAYEDFVEGIRPVLEDKDTEAGTPRYECRDGVFKRMAVEALFASLDLPEADSREAEFEARWTELMNKIEESPGQEYEGLTEKTLYTLAVSPQGNITAHNLKNPGASFYTFSRRNMKKVFLAYPEKKNVTIGDVNDALGVGSHAHLAAVVFRSLMKIARPSKRDVTQGLTASSYKKRKQIVIEYLEGRDKSGYKLRQEGDIPRYVLVIDEINRGNISKILGELVTLLEPDKRIGAHRQLRATLPYSEEVFGVPANLYVVGTMNTADKSIALVDVALRRRFAFQELMPDFGVCKALPASVRDVLDELNRRIALRKDRDHQIGHSYFMAVTTTAEFNRQFAKTTIPLLQEYFYNDWDGLRFVLGETQNEQGAFILSTNHQNAKWARNRWQWYFDAGVKDLDCLVTLRRNYKLNGENPRDDA